MSALAMLQAAGNRGAAGHHAGIGTITVSGGTDGTGNYVDDSYGGIGGAGDNFGDNKAVKETIEKLKGHGFEFNASNGTLVMPGGKSLNVNDGTNKEAMANVGVNPQDFAAAMDTLKSAQAKASEEVEKIGAHTATQGFAGSGGGGAGGTSSGDSISGTDGTDSVGYRQTASADPKPTVAGMTKSYNGEMIGVAGDSIFAMMARRYQQKHKEDAFLHPESNPGPN